MKEILRRWRLLTAVATVILFLGAGSVGARLLPKVDNFIIFPDQSGSMFMTHKKLGQIKMAAAKDLLLKMNELIPELGYKGAIDLFAPWQVILNPTKYDRAAFGDALKTIPTNLGIFNRLTPMGPGMETLPTVLSQLEGKTAVILISDGEANKGTDPVMVAQQIVSNYPNVCFHVISFAEKAKGKAVLKGINEAGKGCVFADGPQLLSDQDALAKFVKDVFYIEESESIILRGIRFDFDKYNIKPEWKPLLDEAAEILKARPNIKIIIGGHTDYIGSEAYNQKLSEKRAKAVYDYLVEKGVDPSRMKWVGYGETRPKAKGRTDEDRAINRRVEFEVVSY